MARFLKSIGGWLRGAKTEPVDSAGVIRMPLPPAAPQPVTPAAAPAEAMRASPVMPLREPTTATEPPVASEPRVRSEPFVPELSA